MGAEDVHAFRDGRAADREEDHALAHDRIVDLIAGLQLFAFLPGFFKGNEAGLFSQFHRFVNAFPLGLAESDVLFVALAQFGQFRLLRGVIGQPGILSFHAFLLFFPAARAGLPAVNYRLFWLRLSGFWIFSRLHSSP